MAKNNNETMQQTSNFNQIDKLYLMVLNKYRGCCGRDRMVGRFITTYAISAYRHSHVS